MKRFQRLRLFLAMLMLLDEAMEMLVSTDGPVDFLSRSNYGQKAGDIFLAQEDEEW